MKTVIKSFVQHTAKNPLAWFLYRACGALSKELGRVYGHASFVREIAERNGKLTGFAGELFAGMTVVHGPFRGLRYPMTQSVGSTLLPKLLGSYESELHPVLEGLLTNNYTSIVNIGCAEGYYAVGLGRRLTKASIYAFDTDENARGICADMARLNGLADRIHIGGFCDAETLKNVPLGSKALVICDCEGYEGRLFTPELAEFLANHDLIIETHDFIDIDISTRLRRVFDRTHHIQSIKSIDDIQKAHSYRFDELEKYSVHDRRQILAERRPAIMEWFVMTPQKLLYPG
ncbi:MAG: hypothetical protein WAQ52_01590 [Terriglobales bacterium]